MQALVFDFFGVLCSETSPAWFKEHFRGDYMALKRELLRPADRGEVSQDELFDELSERTDIPADDIEEDWVEAANLNLELLHYIRTEIKGKYKLGLLTNAMAPYFRTVCKDQKLDLLFDTIVISSEVGLAKPDPEIYRLILSKLGVAPAEALMIDDLQKNVDGAVAVEMQGHLFTSAANLKEVLST